MEPSEKSNSVPKLFFCCCVQILQARPRPAIFRQQALVDDLVDIGAGQLHAVVEAGLDLGEVVALLLSISPRTVLHVFLRRDDDPGPTAALGGQAFGDGLQVGHQLDVVGDVLADLIDEEVQSEIRALASGCKSLTCSAKSSMETL